ncbi:MAG TPA: mercuric reductase [Polyangiaceae bacterium]|nr:mercuric reductase [Polyangiaceae bacterium]
MDYDAIIVGSGQAGVPLAVRLAEAGRRVLIIEKGSFGGTCVNTGCTPTKTLVASARAAHVARCAGRLGVTVGRVDVDFAAVMARKDAIVRRWREGVERRLGSQPERLQVLRGHARFVATDTLEVDGARHRAPLIVINTGARPVLPELPGLDAAACLTNESALDLRELPRRLLVLGGGYIGCELAQMFRRLGSEVAVIYRAEHLLDREDVDTSGALERAFDDEGIERLSSSRVERAARSAAGVELRLVGGRSLEGSHLLVATGRRPNSDDLGLERAGIALDRRGFVQVDDDYRTTAAGVYAVGDVTGGPQFTHASWDDHRRLLAALERPGTGRRGARIVPYTVFTDPEVAGVGLSENEARARGVPFEVATLAFGDVARAIETDETHGTLKVLIDPASERILGCRLVGSQAGELVHVFVVLMQAGASARAIVDAEFVHPTLGEGVQSLVRRLPRYSGS